MTTARDLYMLRDPIPARDLHTVVYAVRWYWPGGETLTLHHTVSGATGRIVGITGSRPGEWTRQGTDYKWRSSDRGTLVIEERKVWP